MKKSIVTKAVKFSALTLLIMSNSFAQTSKLGIGDAAPELKYSKWIKGDPIASFEGKKLYVLEFWATWCGPCKAIMPHVTELQKQYKDQATFIGVGVWEKVPQGQPYETSLPAVIKYVKGNDANMGYSVIADNNEQYMGNQWLRAAGQNGIPSTFIVKDKKIVWIGHPASLDSILPKMIAGKYDIQAAKVANDKSAEAGREMAEKMTAMMKPIDDAVKAKEFNKAFDLMDKIKMEQPPLKAPMDMMRLKVLVDNFTLKEVQEFAQQWQASYKSAPSLVIAEIYNRDNLPKETYLWAAKNFGSTAELKNPLIFDALATLYAKGGEFQNAVAHQEKALEIAKQALKDGTMVGSVMDYTVTEYQEKLQKYKSSMK